MEIEYLPFRRQCQNQNNYLTTQHIKQIQQEQQFNTQQSKQQNFITGTTAKQIIDRPQLTISSYTQQNKSQDIDKSKCKKIKVYDEFQVIQNSVEKDLNKKRLDKEKYIQLLDFYDEVKSDQQLLNPEAPSKKLIFPTQPISLYYETLDNQIYNRNKVHVYFHYDTNNVKYYIINQYYGNQFKQSISLIDQQKINSKHHILQFMYQIPDVFSFPILLIQAQQNQFYFPLHCKRVEPSIQYSILCNNIYQLQDLSISCVLVEFEGPFVKYVNLTLKGLLLSINDSYDQQIIDVNPKNVNVVQMQIFQQNLNEHIFTLDDMQIFSSLSSYKDNIELTDELFFTEEGWRKVCKFDVEEQLIEESNCYLIIDIKCKLFALCFTDAQQCQTAFLLLMSFKKVFQNEQVNTKIQNELKLKQFDKWHYFASRCWFGNYQFALYQKPNLTVADTQIYVEQNIQIHLIQDCVAKMITRRCNGTEKGLICEVVDIIKTQEICMERCFSFAQIEIWSCTRKNIQKCILTTQLQVQPQVFNEIKEFALQQTKQKVSFNVIVEQNKIKYNSVIKIYKYYVNFKSKLLSFDYVDKLDVYTRFATNDSFQLRYDIFDIEVLVQTIMDYYKMLYFFNVL